MAPPSKVNRPVTPPPASQPAPAVRGGSVATGTPAPAAPEARPPQGFERFTGGSQGRVGGLFSPAHNPANQPLKGVRGLPALPLGDMVERLHETLGDNPPAGFFEQSLAAADE